MIKELATYIENNTNLVIGTDLFAGFIPSDIEGDCVVLLESGGKPNFYLPDVEFKAVQILSRATDYFVARDNAYVVYDLLHGKSGIDLPVVTTGVEYRVNTIEAVNLPQSVGKDEKGLFNISTNFILRLQDK